MRRAALIILAAALLGSCAAAEAVRLYQTSFALACARGSDGTDGNIAECYTSRGLDVPEDL